MVFMKIKFILLLSLIILITNNIYVYGDDASIPKGKRCAPIYLNRDGSGETKQYLDNVAIMQRPGQQFTKTQLDNIVSVLDTSSPKILSRISSINSVTNVPWGGETLNNKISINVSGTWKRSFQELVTHEVGHVAISVLPIADKNAFIILNKQSSQPSDYATDYPATRTNWVEDFSDTYMTVKVNPQSLNNGSDILQGKVNIVEKNFNNP